MFQFLQNHLQALLRNRSLLKNATAQFKHFLSKDLFLRRAWRWFYKNRNMLPWYNNKQNKVSLCLTDTSLYIYICINKTSSNCFVQSIVLLDDGTIRPTIRPETCRELEFYNIIVILIKMCAFVGFNCNKWIMVHKMENVKKFLKPSNVPF